MLLWGFNWTSNRSNLLFNSWSSPNPDSSNDELEDAPLTLKDVNQATVDELKELNLGTNNNPHAIFINALLAPVKKEEHLNLPIEHNMTGST